MRTRWWHSIWNRERFWDSREWKRVDCTGSNCTYCSDGWERV